jgi:ribosomal-protein-alanine N-acetyltransferase
MPLPYPEPDLAGDLVRLRMWSYDDLPCVEAAATDPDIPRGTTVPPVYTEAEGRAFIERQWGRETSGRGLSLAIADIGSDRAVGLLFLGLRRTNGHCDLGYWLIPDVRGRGLGSEAVSLASGWVLSETEVYRLTAQVVPDNAASVAVLRKAGFREEGILRQWLWIDDRAVDVLQFSLLRDDLP